MRNISEMTLDEIKKLNNDVITFDEFKRLVNNANVIEFNGLYISRITNYSWYNVALEDGESIDVKVKL